MGAGGYVLEGLPAGRMDVALRIIVAAGSALGRRTRLPGAAACVAICGGSSRPGDLPTRGCGVWLLKWVLVPGVGQVG
jgi:hypothetical protein